MLGERYSTQTIAVGNAGRGGERAEQGITRLPGVLTETEPELVLLLEGVNDLNLYGAAGLQRTLASVGQMITLCRTQGRQVMVGTLPPERPGGVRAGAIALIEPFNDGLKDVVRSQGASLVDVNAGFGGDLSLLGADGLHPTEAGYQRIAQTFFEAIQQKFENPRPIAIVWGPGRPWPERYRTGFIF
jgi:lysophospholipase L1-like esterase